MAIVDQTIHLVGGWTNTSWKICASQNGFIFQNFQGVKSPKTNVWERKHQESAGLKDASSNFFQFWKDRSWHVRLISWMFSLPSQDIRLNITVSLGQWPKRLILGFPRKPCSLPCSSSVSFTFIFDMKKDQFQSQTESTGHNPFFEKHKSEIFADSPKWWFDGDLLW